MNKKIKQFDYIIDKIKYYIEKRNLHSQGIATDEILKKQAISRIKLKHHLVMVSKHTTSCDLCKKWEGKILIDDVYSGGSKKDGDYPLLSDAMKQGLFHKGCRHGISTCFPELLNKKKGNNKDVKMPFEITVTGPTPNYDEETGEILE